MNDRASLQSQAYNTIKALILSKSLDSETLYSETRLAKELGISRTPLREALQCLSQDGYVTIIPSRGFQIRRLDPEAMRESIQARCAIEGFCVHLVADCGDRQRFEALLDDMRGSLERQEDALAGGKMEEFTEEDHNFHMFLVHFAGNSEFDSLFQRLMYRIHLTTANALTVAGRAQATYEEHLALCRHLERGEGDLAYQVLMGHLMMPLRLGNCPL